MLSLISWNCNGGLRNKTKLVDELGVDILVVQECEDPGRSTAAYKEWASNYLWYGKSKNKGIGIFTKKSITIEPLNWSDKNTNYKNETLESFLPCIVNNEFILIGVWTKKANSEVFGYIGQLWKYLQLHKEKIIGKKVIIAGDLNSNAIWDKWDRWWNHSDVVKELEEININSLYHSLYNEKQGSETSPTFYLQRKTEKPYHIDYIFASKEISNSYDLIVGEKEKWLEFSDHLPLIVYLDEL